jgi:phosphoribosylaminoimidazolecarboxamide formyltransferase/IMP cyclohydrolase
MTDHWPIRRALLSVSDKTGLVDLARTLVKHGVELLSTGGTAKALKDAGLPVKLVEEHTGFPEMMDGRLKTLHPKVHGGLLAIRTDSAHTAAAEKHGIPPIDLVIVNLYPFRETVAKPGVSLEHAVENIDIGGPTMVRAAAKNHEFVAVLTSPGQYAAFAEQFASSGGTTLAMRRRLAAEAFSHTGTYDAAISSWLLPRFAEGTEAMFPRELALPFVRTQTARYGENPHQAAAIYADALATGPSVVTARQLHGKELSYNNVNDAAAALELAVALAAGAGAAGSARIGAAVIKHANPCGAAEVDASAGTLLACDRAIAGDPLAAYGGILACTGVISVAAAERLVQKDVFLEVLIAASYEPAALEILKARSANIRLLELPVDTSQPPKTSLTYRSIPGGLLVQQRDVLPPAPSTWEHKAGPAPTASQLRVACATEIMVRAMSSNAIAIGGTDGQSVRLFGGGVGQVDRVTACRLAVEKCKATKADLGVGVSVSDAFFPFSDGPEILIAAGVKMLVHPGGSKRDADTFALCDKHGVTCMVTGTRRFRH